MGYEPQPLLQQLQAAVAVLLESDSTHDAPDATDPSSADADQPAVVSELVAVGTALACFTIPNACNNPGCSNVSGPSEAQLVGGRSCLCTGCRTARYCSRFCQKQHWKLHKPVCKALAAAAEAQAAAAAASLS
jgi:hypothetical protein